MFLYMIVLYNVLDSLTMRYVTTAAVFGAFCVLSVTCSAIRGKSQDKRTKEKVCIDFLSRNYFESLYFLTIYIWSLVPTYTDKATFSVIILTIMIGSCLHCITRKEY